jgi:hypothetical protein
VLLRRCSLDMELDACCCKYDYDRVELANMVVLSSKQVRFQQYVMCLPYLLVVCFTPRYFSC